MPSMVERLEYFSSLHCEKRAYVVSVRYCRHYFSREFEAVSVEEMELAEQYIVKLVQKQAFSKEMSSLKQEKEDENH
jgi:hypothetical protein